MKKIEEAKPYIGAVPLEKGDIKLRLDEGESLYVLGPNGAGKSTLIYKLASEKGRPIVLVAGNREILFKSSAVSISAQQAEQITQWGSGVLAKSTSRYEKAYHNNSERLSSLLFSLKSLCDDVNKKYRQAHQAGRVDELATIADNEPILLINEALKKSSIDLTLDWDEKSALIVTKEDQQYGVNSMSDGERAALILACEVILAKKGAVVLIDEPERHLHRSISSPILQYLRSIRSDLRWVIATHDLSLPRDDAAASVLIVYRYYGNSQWEAELLEDGDQLPPPLLEAIYGARQKVIFVEGGKESRDSPIYQQLFKGITIVPAGNCRDVCECVAGLGSVKDIHRIEGRGLVDGDNRIDAASLANEGVFALKVYAIESVYYHPDVISEMLKHAPVDITLDEVIEAALSNLGDAKHLSRMTAYRSYRERHMKSMLDEESFASSAQVTETVNGPHLIAEAQARLEQLRHEGNWSEITKLYKIKASGSPKAIALKLGYNGCNAYEHALIKSLGRDGKLFDAVRSLIPDPFTSGGGDTVEEVSNS